MKTRRMKVEDISRVAEVEEESFERPWSEEALYRDYAQNPSSNFFVAEVDHTVVGHIGLWRRHDHVHITTLAVSVDARREGVGMSLLRRVQEEFPDMDITLEVRKSNVSAQEFYREAGFSVTGSRPDYYTDNGEDALVMSLHSDAREPVADGRS